MKLFKSFSAIILACLSVLSCSKVDPTGVLIGHTSVDDRVKQSIVYYRDWDRTGNDIYVSDANYSFLVGSDSHLRDDMTRLEEMFDDQIAHNDLFSAHCGDLAETQPEYYVKVEDVIDGYRKRYPEGYAEGKNAFRFFPVVGNHDITRNGWALFTKIFAMSTYTFDVVVTDVGGKEICRDVFIFLDSANGTFGEYQFDLIDLDLLFDETVEYRHKFVFTHTNIFRPRKNAFSSILPREELYHTLATFHDWNVDIAFLGHIHAWDDRVYGGVRYITLDAMSADNNPEYGEVVRCHVGDKVSIDRVRLK